MKEQLEALVKELAEHAAQEKQNSDWWFAKEMKDNGAFWIGRHDSTQDCINKIRTILQQHA